MIVAVLSTSVMPKDGTYKIKTVNFRSLNFKGIPHYIGHPCTRKIVERLGAIPSRYSSFRGLRVGESAICCPIAHNKQNRRRHKFTRANQQVTVNELCFRILTRIQ